MTAARFDSFEAVSDVLRTLVAALIAAGPQFGLDTETMIRIWCFGGLRVTPDSNDSDRYKVEMVPDAMVDYLANQGHDLGL